MPLGRHVIKPRGRRSLTKEVAREALTVPYIACLKFLTCIQPGEMRVVNWFDPKYLWLSVVAACGHMICLYSEANSIRLRERGVGVKGHHRWCVITTSLPGYVSRLVQWIA
jgi:hypothetical protein